MSQSDKDRNPFTVEKVKEFSKSYALIILTAAIFSGLMFVSSGIIWYVLGQSINPDIVLAIDGVSHHETSMVGLQIMSAIVVGFNVAMSVLAYYQLRKWLHIHNQNVAQGEKFKVKFWPVLAMGFVVAMALGVLGAIIDVTNTPLHGLDPISIYHALKSGSYYGWLAVLLAMPMAGVIIIKLGPKTYHYVEGLEERHKSIPDIPDLKKEKPDTTNE